MAKTTSNFRIGWFRGRLFVWIMLTVLGCSFMPAVSFAQQPTAAIRTLSGTVLVSGQTAKIGAVLTAGDTLQTQAGASVVLTLSDGSEIHLGEQTQIHIADLVQTSTGARVSSIKLLAGWLRAILSAQHQQPGSAFTIETPNAQIGVKFSQPDVEVSYEPAKQETIGIAHTVALTVINLLTNEKITVPVGSSVIIIGLLLKVIAGTTTAAIAAGTTGTGTATTGTTAVATAAGLGTGTIVAISAGALAAAGGVVAIASSSSGGGESNIDVSRWADCSQAHTVGNSINVWDCQSSGGFTVRNGRSYWIRMSIGYTHLGINGETNARADQPYISLLVTMNSGTLPMDGTTVVEYNQLAGFWEVNSYHCTGVLASGNYTIIGTSSSSVTLTDAVVDSATCVLRVR